MNEEMFNDILLKIISISLIIVITLIINYIIDLAINKTIKVKRKKNLTTLLIFIKNLKKIVLIIICVLICLSKFKMFSSLSVTLLSGLGIGSVVIGLAAQESLKNFFGSISIVTGSPFEVGDFIECPEKNVSGTVEDITMRHTVIRTINNKRVIIPNSEMNNLIVENYNYSDNEVVKIVEYSISYESDIDKAIKIMKNEMKKLYQPNPNGKNKNAEFPKVRVSSWQDSGIGISAYIWGKDRDNVFENMYNLNYSLKKSFEKNGIDIPYPHVKVVSEKK